MGKSKKLDVEYKEIDPNTLARARAVRRLRGELTAANEKALAVLEKESGNPIHLIIDYLKSDSDDKFSLECQKLCSLLEQYDVNPDEVDMNEIKTLMRTLEISDIHKPMMVLAHNYLGFIANTQKKCLQGINDLTLALDQGSEDYDHSKFILTTVKKYISDPIGAEIKNRDVLAFINMADNFGQDLSYLIDEIRRWIEITSNTEEDDQAEFFRSDMFGDIEDEQLKQDLVHATHMMNLVDNKPDTEDVEDPVVELPPDMMTFLQAAGII